MSNVKNYTAPTIETLESSEILDLIGPVQGYGYGDSGGGGAAMGITGQLTAPPTGAVRPSSN